jgi:hypothetical protein
MIEKVVYEYLKTALAPIDVFTEIRQGMPSTFVFIEKTGSSMRDRLKVARFAVQSYGASLFEAASLNQDVIEAMLNMVSEAEVSNVELNSDYNYTDTQTKTPRYQAVFEITHY